jgi:O-antigen ligase
VILLALLVLGAFALAERAGVVGLAKLTLVVTAIIVALAVIAQVYLGSFRPFDGGWRLAGIMHPVALSWYCGLGAIASIALSRQFPGRRGVLLTATAVFLATLVLTRTRTGIAGALVGIAALWFLSDRKKLRQRLAVTSVVLGLMLFGAILASAYGLTWSATYGSFVDITSLGREDALDQFSTFSGRLPIWVASLQLAAERPLLGYGYNAFSSPELLGEFARTVGWVPTSTHSGYFEALLSLGAIGLALFATLIAAGIRASLLMVSRRPEQAFTVAVLLWLGVNLVFEAPVFFDPIFVAGLSYALLMDIGFFSITSLTSEVVTQ